MIIRKQRSYKKVGKDGVTRTVFVYAVSGSKEQLEAYRNAMGDNYKESEEGVPLWFTTRFVGERGNLIITSAGKVVADMSKFDELASLAEQYPGAIGKAIAEQGISKLLAGQSQAPAPKEQPSNDALDK